MRLFRFVLVLAAAGAAGGCFQSSTVLHVKADRSGTIQERLVFTGAALAQFKQFAQLGGPGAKTPELLSEDQARAMAGNIGTGVSYVSSKPIKTDEYEGRESLYAFTDIDSLRIAQQPPGPGGVTVRADNVPTSKEITFHLEPQPDGHAVLHIAMPDLTSGVPGLSPQAQQSGGAPTAPTPQQLEMAKRMFAGMHVSVSVETDGRVVRTNAPFVEGNHVTLMEVDFDQLMSNDTALQQLSAAKSPADVQALMKSLPGLKLALERDITIEFAPGAR